MTNSIRLYQRLWAIDALSAEILLNDFYILYEGVASFYEVIHEHLFYHYLDKVRRFSIVAFLMVVIHLPIYLEGTVSSCTYVSIFVWF